MGAGMGVGSDPHLPDSSLGVCVAQASCDRVRSADATSAGTGTRVADLHLFPAASCDERSAGVPFAYLQSAARLFPDVINHKESWVIRQRGLKQAVRCDQ